MPVVSLSIKATGAGTQVGLDACAAVHLIKPAGSSGLKSAVDRLLQSA